MLLEGSLVPGDRINQAEIAQALGVSRIPVREALARLTDERVIRHVPDVGYSVTRMNITELEQIYVMRRLLETELFKTIPFEIPQESIATLKAYGKQMELAAEKPDIVSFQAHNRLFHFTLFQLAGCPLIEAEVQRLWNMVASYQPLYIYDSEARARVIAEHELFITSAERSDTTALINLADAHRTAAVETLTRVLRYLRV